MSFEPSRTLRLGAKGSLTRRDNEESLPRINRTTQSGSFGIEDFYLTSLTQQLGVSSKRFEKVKSQRLESLMKQTIKSGLSTAVSSTDPHSNNLLTTGSLTQRSDPKPSYGCYSDTLPQDLKVLFRDSLAMEKLLRSFDNSFYCLEEVISIQKDKRKSKVLQGEPRQPDGTLSVYYEDYC